jgi:CDP-glucose 4,6-dehydratase
MHFLITGHTGFKGAWLSLLLRERGHKVSGIALEPEINSLFSKSALGNIFENDIRCDLRVYEKLAVHFREVSPDVVVHMAAQALVRESYRDPITTYETNVMGTINVLKASQSLPNLKAQLIVTTDKVYKNVDKSTGYVESDPLGGQDPYSASKAMADIATQSWLASFDNAPTAIARAGNVIGGGDICEDRLIPDLVKSYSSDLIPKLRAPDAVRPWQHVLDCLNGYLVVVDALLDGNGSGAWNIGPDEAQVRSVADVTNIAGDIWERSIKWEQDSGFHPHEANLLLLNAEKARTKLGWQDKLSFEESIGWTINWYKNIHSGSEALKETRANIRAFEEKASS